MFCWRDQLNVLDGTTEVDTYASWQHPSLVYALQTRLRHALTLELSIVT